MSVRRRLLQALGLEAELEDEQERFVNRINAGLLNVLPRERKDAEWMREVCFELGLDYGIIYKRFNPYGMHLLDGPHTPSVRSITNDSFRGTIELLPALYAVWKARGLNVALIDRTVGEALARVALDLGVRWQDGTFYATGAEELDAALIQSPSEWLAKHPNERSNFNRAAEALLARKHDEVSRHCYVVVEGLARHIVGNERTLDANREALVAKLELQDEWKTVVKGYLAYLHAARHATDRSRVTSEEGAEACLYLTGTIVRLMLRHLPQA